MHRLPATTACGWIAAAMAIAAILGLLPSRAQGELVADAALIAAGERLYRTGITHSGAQLQAAVRTDVPISGNALACTQCHRRSGLGSSEGGVGIPPIAGGTLFTDQVAGLVRDFRNGDLGNISRPAYTLDTLARALREGVDSAGRVMSPLMPRYRIADEDLQAIAAYLPTLSAAPSPGITEHEMHFATVVTPDASATERQAMLAVMTAYFAGKNAGTRGEVRRAEHAPFHREWSYSAYRKWVLHEWALTGPPHSWSEQLERYYRAQPVFALLGGIGHRQWHPVHAFCEQYSVPCLFPHLDAPPPNADRDFYSFYFSKGLMLEAEALAAHLQQHGHGHARLLQVLRATPEQLAAAAALRKALSAPGNDHLIATSDIPDEKYWRQLLQRTQPEVLVLWLTSDDLAGLMRGVGKQPFPVAIYLSSTLLPDHGTLDPKRLDGRLKLLHPFQLPGEELRQMRFRIWAGQAGIPIRNLRVESDAYFAVTLAGEALMHIRGNLLRDYLIERIEHMTDSMIYTSTYPRLALAPGQRYAAKGAYVWQLNQAPETAEWVVP